MLFTEHGLRTIPETVSPMNKPLSAVLGGAVGTAIMSLVLAMIEIEARYAIGIFEAIARFMRVPDNPALGFVIYVLVGTFVWPLLFLSLEAYVPLDLDPAIAGMLMGTVLWIAFAIIGEEGIGGALLLVYLSFTLLAHLAYGFAMGAVYARFAGHESTIDGAPGDVS